MKLGENDRGLEHWRILYLDGIHFSIHHGDKTDSTIILMADGELIWPETKRCWRGHACAEESKDGWVCEARKTCEGEAPSRLISLSLTVTMDCWLRSRHSLRPLLVNAGESHKQRNVLGAIPRRERGEVQAELDGIWSQPTKPEAVAQLAIFKAKYAQRYPQAVRSLAEDEENTFTFFAFPQRMHRHIQTTNAIESL